MYVNVTFSLLATIISEKLRLTFSKARMKYMETLHLCFLFIRKELLKLQSCYITKLVYIILYMILLFVKY